MFHTIQNWIGMSSLRKHFSLSRLKMLLEISRLSVISDPLYKQESFLKLPKPIFQRQATATCFPYNALQKCGKFCLLWFNNGGPFLGFSRKLNHPSSKPCFDGIAAYINDKVDIVWNHSEVVEPGWIFVLQARFRMNRVKKKRRKMFSVFF